MTAPLVEDGVAPGPAEADPDTTRRGVADTVAHTLGELLITVGVVLLLLCVYQLWWTNVESAVATNSERAKIIAQWDRPVVPGPIGPAVWEATR